MHHLNNVFNNTADQIKAEIIAREMHNNRVDDEQDTFEANADFEFIHQNEHLFAPENQWDSNQFHDWFWSFYIE